MRVYRYYYDYSRWCYRFEEYSSIEEIIEKFASFPIYDGYLIISIDKRLFIYINFDYGYSYIRVGGIPGGSVRDYFEKYFPKSIGVGYMQFMKKGNYYSSGRTVGYSYSNINKADLISKVMSGISIFINKVNNNEVECKNDNYQRGVSGFRFKDEIYISEGFNPGDFTNVYNANYYVRPEYYGEKTVGFILSWYDIGIRIRCNDYLFYKNKKCCSCQDLCYSIGGFNLSDDILVSIN